MKKILSVTLALALLLTTACAYATEAANADYSVAEKLLKQLWAGSGFSGTMTLDIAANEGAPPLTPFTKQSMNFQWDYIYVRDNGLVQEERRADLALMDGETVKSTAHFQLQNGALNLQADLLGEGWYSLPLAEQAAPGGEADQAEQGALSALLSGAMGALYEKSGVPSLAAALTPMLLGAQREPTAEMQALWDSYITRMDLWIEGYRKSTVLGKLEDGTGTMELTYAITAANIKSQLKQMLLDLLSDAETLPQLQAYLGEKYAALYLNPELRPYYFNVIDGLPLNGDLTIDRTVSLRGETLALHLSLPFYDAKGGAVTLRYDRVRGDGDLPDENTISLDGEQRLMELKYLEYSSMTDMTVVQGTLYSASSQEGAEAEKPFAAAFTFRHQETVGRDAEDQDTYGYQAQWSVGPDPQRDAETIMAFDDFEVMLNADFVSKALKTAPTEITATLAVGGEKQPQTITLMVNGKTRKQWMPEEPPQDKLALNALSGQELTATIQSLALKAGALLLPYLGLTGEAGADGSEAADAATDAPEATATPTPEATATSTPEATATPTPEATATPTPEATATPAPETTATPTPSQPSAGQ